MIPSRDPDGARRLVPQLAQGGQAGVDLVEGGRYRPEQLFARFGGSHGARGPGQQPDAQPRLELADGLAEGGLRGAQLCGSAREAACLRNGLQSQEVGQVLAAQFISSRYKPMPILAANRGSAARLISPIATARTASMTTQLVPAGQATRPRALGRRLRPHALRLDADRVRVHAGQPADADRDRPAHERRAGRPGDRRLRASSPC